MISVRNSAPMATRWCRRRTSTVLRAAPCASIAPTRNRRSVRPRAIRFSADCDGHDGLARIRQGPSQRSAGGDHVAAAFQTARASLCRDGKDTSSGPKPDQSSPANFTITTLTRTNARTSPMCQPSARSSRNSPVGCKPVGRPRCRRQASVDLFIFDCGRTMRSRVEGVCSLVAGGAMR